jgi:hypothetical protein
MSKPLLERFLLAEKGDVFQWFGSLPGAVRGNKYLYVPGTKEKSVLLVAHADTVFSSPASSIEWYGNIARANIKWGAGKQGKWRSQGLGADDRAGCALMWTFRNSGHSILITDEEEKGCIGAGIAAQELALELSNHLFAIEVDRRGDMNYVYYDMVSKQFDEWIRPLLPGWEEQVGSFSDIAEICAAVGICGINLAAGYIDEHTSDETFFLDAWWRTRGVVERILNRASEQFLLPEGVKNKRGRGIILYGGYGYDEYDDGTPSAASKKDYEDWDDYWQHNGSPSAFTKDCQHREWLDSTVHEGLEYCSLCMIYRLNEEALLCEHDWFVVEARIGLQCPYCGLSHKDWLEHDDTVEQIIEVEMIEDEDPTDDTRPSWQKDFDAANREALKIIE